MQEKVMKPVTVNGEDLVLTVIDGKVYAFEDNCPHADAPLSGGEIIDGKEVVCPVHGACFDIKTGDVKEGPAFEGIKVYKVLEEDDKIFIL